VGKDSNLKSPPKDYLSTCPHNHHPPLRPTNDMADIQNIAVEAAADDGNNNGSNGDSNVDTSAIISSFAERLAFFFSNANLRQDKWMRQQLSSSHDGNSLSLDTLLKFNTLKVISTDKSLLALAAQHESLQTLISYDADKEEIRRVVPFDYKTMGDGSKLSLYVKNVPVTEPPSASAATATAVTPSAENKEDDAVADDDEKEPEADSTSTNATGAVESTNEEFRSRYAVSRDDIKSLFERYGRIGIVQLRYGRKSVSSKPSIVGNEDYEKYTSPSQRALGRGESYPLGVAIVEFETLEGMENACKDLLIHDSNEDGTKENAVKDDDDDEEEKVEEDSGKGAMAAAEGKTVLELHGNQLVIERMRPSKFFQKNTSNKRSRDENDNEDGGKDDDDNEEGDEAATSSFEPITIDWKKGCVIALAGLSTTSCDREAIRDAVSDILGVTKDVKSSGLYVDYTRGQSTGNLRLNDPKPDEMAELVAKLMDGSVVIANQKVESAKILEGEEEEQYMKDYVAFLNRMKKMKEEEKRSQKRFKRHGGGGRGGRGRGGRGRGRGKR
jgi:hypothetical protein